jgi:hypothetical protein
MKKLSQPQRQALEDVERHGNPRARVFGQAQHGGWHSVMRVIERQRWARFDGRKKKWVLTDAGRAALREAS